MTKLTITWIGQPKDIQTKYGPKQKNSLKATEYGDNYLDFWIGDTSKNWKVGDVIEVLEVSEREYNGKIYRDISLPKADNRPAPLPIKELSDIANKVGLINAKLDRIISHLNGENPLDRTSDGSPMPNFDRRDYPEAE